MLLAKMAKLNTQRVILFYSMGREYFLHILYIVGKWNNLPNRLSIYMGHAYILVHSGRW